MLLNFSLFFNKYEAIYCEGFVSVTGMDVHPRRETFRVTVNGRLNQSTS